MSGFILKRHSVKEAYFKENSEIEKKKNIEVEVEGSFLIPKDLSENRKIIANISCCLGKADEKLLFTVKTTTVFEAEECLGTNISEQIVQEECLPIALAQLRKSIKNISEAYGRTPIDLPPFDEENNE